MILKAIATKLVVFDGGRISLFEGTYDDFLERVGWEEEKAMRGSGNEKRAEARDKGTSRKDMRRMRAQIIDSRSKALGPLQSRISELEETITRLERQVHEDNNSLIRLSSAGDGRAISALHISIYNAQNEIEKLFDEMDALTGELHRRSLEYEDQLNELGQI
jgi:ATP-binding cassette subfamily F protein 3